MPAEPDTVAPSARSGWVVARASATWPRTAAAGALGATLRVGEACTERFLSSMAWTSSCCARAQSSKQARRVASGWSRQACQARAGASEAGTGGAAGAAGDCAPHRAGQAMDSRKASGVGRKRCMRKTEGSSGRRPMRPGEKTESKARRARAMGALWMLLAAPPRRTCIRM